MSRIGKMPISVPAGVDVKIDTSVLQSRVLRVHSQENFQAR